MICPKEWFSSITTTRWLGLEATGSGGRAAVGRDGPATETPQPASPTDATTTVANTRHTPEPAIALASTIVAAQFACSGGRMGTS